jgi:ABC-2 type transport system permease protein
MKTSLRRIKLVASREFLTTVSSKGFLFGVLVMPVLLITAIMLIPKLMANRGAQVEVEVAVIDAAGSGFTQSLRSELSNEAILARQDAGRRAAAEQLGAGGLPSQAGRVAAVAISIPSFTIRELPRDATVTQQQGWLTARDLGKRQRRALVVVPPGAVQGDARGGYATYEFYAPRNLPPDAESILHSAIRPALVAERLRHSGLDPELVRAATSIPRTPTVLVAPDGSQQGSQVLNRMMPFVMGILLFLGIMTGGQGLMTSTVEEKSSRVVEVLLAAVSSLELMWGKLLGQLGVGLVMMGMYVIVGLLALLQLATVSLIDPLLVLWLFLFFLMSYLVFGALMMAIGAAVNQIADAQSLMGPVMLLLVIPYVATAMIGGAPDAPFAVVSSFIPPINGFTMMARLASSSPPPVWQVLVSLALSALAAWLTVWFASKVFRVGLLMHGKPPTFATLIRWARMG